MKTTLLSILWKKEKIHWNRTGLMLKKFESAAQKWTLGALAVLFGGILFHYGTVLMSTLWELTLYVFNRKMFKENVQRMALKV